MSRTPVRFSRPSSVRYNIEMGVSDPRWVARIPPGMTEPRNLHPERLDELTIGDFKAIAEASGDREIVRLLPRLNRATRDMMYDSSRPGRRAAIFGHIEEMHPYEILRPPVVEVDADTVWAITQRGEKSDDGSDRWIHEWGVMWQRGRPLLRTLRHIEARLEENPEDDSESSGDDYIDPEDWEVYDVKRLRELQAMLPLRAKEDLERQAHERRIRARLEAAHPSRTDDEIEHERRLRQFLDPVKTAEARR